MKSYLIIITFIFLVFNSLAQSDESIVAKVGNDKITAREFKLRLELSPYLPKDLDMSKDSVKYDLLYSMIAEKLWALKAKDMGIENTQEFDFFFRPIEDLFVRDALFKQEIESKNSVSAMEMEKGIYKSQFTQLIRFIPAKDSATSFNIYKRLIQSLNIDSTINSFSLIDDTTIGVKFGDLDLETIEDTIYSLKKGTFTNPVKFNDSWIIFYCLDNIFTPINISDQQTTNDIKKIIKRRKLEILYNNYRNKLLSGTYIKLNPIAISLLSNSFWKVLKLKSPVVDKEKEYFELNEKDFKDILSSLNKTELNTQLFELKEKELNVYNLLSTIAFSGFSITRLDSFTVYSKTVSIAKKFIEEQILTMEGYKKNYNLLPAVQNDLKMWKQKYLAQMFMISVLDSIKVTEEDLSNFYYNDVIKGNNIVFVKLQLVTLNDLEEISALLQKMNTGIEFGSISQFYGRTDSLLDLKGETGLLPLSLLGDLKDAVSGMHLNEIFGPIKRSNGYSIFKLIEKEEKPDSTLPPFEEIKNQLTTNLRFKILNDKLNEITTKSSLQQNVKIFNEVVDKVTATQVPMFVHRLMGFGGRIAGVPLTTPFSGWINNEIKQKMLP
jgi:hypothetical protein